MDIKYLIENEYMKCVLQINGFSGPCPQVRSASSGPVQPSGGVESGLGPRQGLYGMLELGIPVFFLSLILDLNLG